jgi:hypothetical protein
MSDSADKATGGLYSDVMDVGQSAIDTVKDIGVSLDQTVRDTVPGGWVGAAALAAGGFEYSDELGAWFNGEGTTVPGDFTGAAQTDAASALQTNTAFTGDLPAGYTGYTAPTATDLGTVAGSTTGIASGATDAASSSIFDNITLGNVGSAMAIATGINALTGGGVTKALGLGGSTTVNTGGGTVTTSPPGTTTPLPGGGTTGGTTDIATPAGALKVADPFSAYRSQMADLYAGYLTGGNKTDITQMPGYSQFQTGVLDPAMEATKRSAAKSGQMVSGNELIALQKQGQTGYYGFMTDYLNRLATASGASSSPATAAQLASGTATAQQQATMQGIGGVLTGAAGLVGASNLANLYGGSGSSNTYTGSPGGMYAGDNFSLSNVPNQTGVFGDNPADYSFSD